MNTLLLVLALSSDRHYLLPKTTQIGVIDISAEIVSVPRNLPGGEAADLSFRVYAMRKSAGVCITVSDIEADDHDMIGTPTTIAGVLEF